MRKSLTRKERLRKKKDISGVFEQSESRKDSCMRILYRRNSLEWNRIAVILRKGYGNSVIRNRARRLVKETYREMKNSIFKGYDIIFLVNSRITEYETAESSVCMLLRKTGLIDDNKDPA